MERAILLDHQNNYIERLNVNDNAVQNFNILAISLNDNLFGDDPYFLMIQKQNYF